MFRWMLLALVLNCALQASGCRCSGQLGTDRADVVFTGTASEVTSNHKWILVTFSVDTVFKGAHRSTIKVKMHNTSCAKQFRQGTMYVVYANRRSTRLEVSRCSCTKEITGTDARTVKLESGTDGRPPF
jgi:hypothetical protein